MNGFERKVKDDTLLSGYLPIHLIKMIKNMHKFAYFLYFFAKK